MSNVDYRRLPSYFVPDLLNIQRLQSSDRASTQFTTASDNQIVKVAGVAMHTVNESISSIGKDDLQRINYDVVDDDNINPEKVEVITDFYVTRVKNKNKQISLKKQYQFIRFGRPNIDKILKIAKEKYAKNRSNNSKSDLGFWCR